MPNTVRNEVLQNFVILESFLMTNHNIQEKNSFHKSRLFHIFANQFTNLCNIFSENLNKCKI